MTPQRVVVTGLGVASSLGCAVEEFWRRLIGGGIRGSWRSRTRRSPLSTRIGAVVQGYEPREHFDRKEVRRLSGSSQLAVVAASQAVSAGKVLSLDAVVELLRP